MKTTNWPATVRELAQMAEQRGLDFGTLLERLEAENGPMPLPPASYTLAPGTDDLWIGTETINGGWILTPGWKFDTGHCFNVWTIQDRDLTPTEALQLAAALTDAAQATRNAE